MANTWARWVWTVRRETNRRSPIWGLERPSATSATTRCSVGVRLPSRAGAAADAQLAQAGLGPGGGAGRVQALVGGQGPLQQGRGRGGVAVAGEGGAGVLGGQGQLEGARTLGVGVHGRAQQAGVVAGQAAAAQGGPGDPGDGAAAPGPRWPSGCGSGGCRR